MSLINDALKRATQAQSPQPSITKSDTPMRAVADAHGSVGLPTYFIPVLLFIFTGACFFLVRGWDARRQAGLYPDPVVVEARETPPVPPVPVTPSNAVAAEAAAPVATEVPQPVPENRAFGLDDAPAPPTREAFRLQGIFYRPSRPSAVVNAQTVYIGDTIANGRVKAITRESITLVVDGQDKVLTLR
jgi:hypothetical protein